MSKVEDLITDRALELTFANANFGNLSKREVVRESLLKCACDGDAGVIADHSGYVLNSIPPQAVKMADALIKSLNDESK